MDTTAESFAVSRTYRVMRCLGTVTGSICQGFFFVVPFARPGDCAKRRTCKVDTAAKAPSPPARQETGIAGVASYPYAHVSSEKQQVAEIVPAVQSVVETVEVVQSVDDGEQAGRGLKAEPGNVDDILNGIPFESKMQRLQSEVYVKDFISNVEEVRKESLEQIEKLPKPVAIKILQKLLLLNGDSIRIIEILSAISSLNEDAGLERSLFVPYLISTNPAVRLAALGALSKYKDEESFSILSRSLQDSDSRIRKQALNLLSWNYNEKSADSVMKMLQDVDINVRKRAIYFCGSLKLGRSISSLISLLSDPVEDIQKCASDALREITGQDFGFKPSSSMKSRDVAIEAWLSWWRLNQATFGV